MQLKNLLPESCPVSTLSNNVATNFKETACGCSYFKMAEKEVDTREGAKVQEDAKRWTDERTQTLITELEKYPCLYNSTLKEYHDRNERKTCYEAMTKVLDVSG